MTGMRLFEADLRGIADASAPRMDMRVVTNILRLKHHDGLSHKCIATALSIFKE